MAAKTFFMPLCSPQPLEDCDLSLLNSKRPFCADFWRLRLPRPQPRQVVVRHFISYDDLKNLHTIYCPPPQRAAFPFPQRLLPHRDCPQKANNALLVHTRSGFCRSAFAGTRQSESETLARRDCSETARISRQQAIASARCWCRHRLFYFFAFAAWA